MSYSASSAARSESKPAPLRSPKAKLRVIEGAKGQVQRHLFPIILVMVGVFVIAILIPLIANTYMAQLSYEIRDQRIQIREYQAQIDTLEADLLRVQSTESLRNKALEIGMVPAGEIGVITLESGTVEGGVPAQ